MREYLSDDDVEREIERLTTNPDVQLARAEQRMKYKKRQYLYQLRNLAKRGQELREAGITQDNLYNLSDYFDNKISNEKNGANDEVQKGEYQCYPEEA